MKSGKEAPIPMAIPEMPSARKNAVLDATAIKNGPAPKIQVDATANN